MEFFIVHCYAHTLHRPRSIPGLHSPAFHITSSVSESGQILSNSFRVKNRINCLLFTTIPGRGQIYDSAIIPFTEKTVKKGCFPRKLSVIHETLCRNVPLRTGVSRY